MDNILNINFVLGLVSLLSAIFLSLVLINLISIYIWNGKYINYFEKLSVSSSDYWISICLVPVYNIMCWFVGKNVGMKAEFGTNTKYFGPYIEHITLFYWILSPILVMTFHPKEVGSITPSSLDIAIAFIVLMTVNIFGDCASILLTKYNIFKIIKKESPTVLYSCAVIFFDIGIATSFFIFTQFISSCLYPVQVGLAKITDYEIMIQYGISLETPFKLYTLSSPNIAEHDSLIEFAGQLVISMTSYIPTFFLLIYCFIAVILTPISKITTKTLVLFGSKDGYTTISKEKLILMFAATIVPIIELCKLTFDLI